MKVTKVIVCCILALSSLTDAGLNDFFAKFRERVSSMFLGRTSSQSRSISSVTRTTTTPLPPPIYISNDPENVRFLLYDERLNPSKYKEIKFKDIESIQSTKFDSTKPTKILIHGFKNNATGEKGYFPRETRKAYLENTDDNIICVDWGELSTPRVRSGASPEILYPLAVTNVPVVGKRISEFVKWLLQENILNDLGKVHVIGFSLGAHVAGLAGYYVQQSLNGTRFSRITGLDPAGPMFYNAIVDHRLDSSDAEFVDVIHSSRLGMNEEIGHADFYPNGGRFQFDCFSHNNDIVSSGDSFQRLARVLTGYCDHSRAPIYFTQSIKEGRDAIFACKCKSWTDYLRLCKGLCTDAVNFGEYCPHSARGNYYLEIRI